MSKAFSSTITSATSSSSSKRPRAGKESVRTTRRSQSSEAEARQLLEGADVVDPTEAEEDGRRERVGREERVSTKKLKEEPAVAVVAPPSARRRPRKVCPAAEVVAVAAPETGEKEKVQRFTEKDVRQQQHSSEREVTRQESDNVVLQPRPSEKEMTPQETDKEVDGNAPDDGRPSVALQASIGSINASELQAEVARDSGGAAAAAAAAAAVELEEEDNEDDDGGFDIKEGDEIIVINNASGGAVELKRGDGGAGQGPDDGVRNEDDDEQPQPPLVQENQDPLTTESSEPAKTTRKSSRVSSTTSENGSTASTNTHPKPSSTSKRKLEEQPDPELQEQHVQKNANNAKKKQKTIAKISPASSRNLFQFTCKLLESQRLEYEVRAREFEEKNVALAAKRAKWEKKIRSVKRQLREYGHPVDGVYDEARSGVTNGSNLNGMSSSAGSDSRFQADPDWGMGSTSTALTTSSGGLSGVNGNSSESNTSLITMRDAFSSRTSFPSGVGGPGGVDSLLPASIQSIEAQIRDTLGSRAKLVSDMIKELQTMRGLNDKITRLR